MASSYKEKLENIINAKKIEKEKNTKNLEANQKDNDITVDLDATLSQIKKSKDKYFAQIFIRESKMNNNIYYSIDKNMVKRNIGNEIKITFEKNGLYDIYVQNRFNGKLTFAGKMIGDILYEFGEKFREAYKNNPSITNYEKTITSLNSEFISNLYNNQPSRNENNEKEANKNNDKAQKEIRPVKTIKDHANNKKSVDIIFSYLEPYLVNELKKGRAKKIYLISNDKIPETFKTSDIQTMIEAPCDITGSMIGLDNNNSIAKKGEYINITKNKTNIASKRFVEIYYEETAPTNIELQKAIDDMDIFTNDFRFHRKNDVEEFMSEHSLPSYSAVSQYLENNGVNIAFDKYTVKAISHVQKLEKLSNSMEEFNKDFEKSPTILK